MSWFGDTFGDSLNTLKGQITKITKEVLADEGEPANSEKEEPDLELVKELQALCESKDLEIASLKDEYKKLKDQYESQVVFSGNNDSDDLQNKNSELVRLRQERDHLNSCLDELQSEHQLNLDQVISIRDKYKSELEELRKEYNSVKEKLLHSTANATAESKNEAVEVQSLNSQIEKLQCELESEKKEKEKLYSCFKSQEDDLRNKIDKLQCDIQVISDDRQKTEERNKSIGTENENLRSMLNIKEKEVKESEIKVKLLTNEKAELFRKSVTEVGKKLKSLLQVVNADEVVGENNIVEVLSIIENNLKSLQETNGKMKEIERQLKEENECLQKLEKTQEEEISSLRKTVSEMKEKSHDCITQSQTDDVKRLEQEVAHFMNLMVAKNNEVNDYSKSLSNLEQELQNLKTASSKVEEELLTTKNEKKKLEDEIEHLKSKEMEIVRNFETEKSNLTQMNTQLKSKTDELEKQILEMTEGSDKTKTLKEELDGVLLSKQNLEKLCEELEKTNINLKNDFEHMKAQIIVKESAVAELMKSNAYFQEEMNKVQAENIALKNSEKEIKKWKDASVDLEIQRQDLIASKEEVENECLRLRGELQLLEAKDAEIQLLKQTNLSLVESCNQLHHQLEAKAQTEHVHVEQENELKKQSEFITELQEENAELKSRIQKFQEQMKMQIVNSQANTKEEVQQHRRSKSDMESSPMVPSQAGEDLTLLKQTVLQEQAKYRLLQQQYQEIAEKEASARKEFERLRQHLIEVEDHYTEEAVENEKLVNELKSKLMAAEEQLQNSSTLYTSLKVRDNQHLESLQSQIRLVSAQRDDLQSKLSAAEDEVQKHKASLMSLQIVLEQFQQDKEREVEEVAMKYEKQLQLTHERFRDLEAEIEGLKKQLSEAKNGLKAASRLGEQLEKKTQLVSELEENLNLSKSKMSELEESLATANQAQNGKIDKSLIKNLVVGYVLSPNADRKSQALKIMASVLDFDQEERNKMGVDANSSGWLANILHPKGGAPSNQSLSEAFIKFLENESRPQPQLKLLPEQFPSTSPNPSRTSPKPPPPRISELTLPTFNSFQENESNILKNVLKDS